MSSKKDMKLVSVEVSVESLEKYQKSNEQKKSSPQHLYCEMNPLRLKVKLQQKLWSKNQKK